MTATVSAKIPDEMKKDIEDEDINVSEVIRNALEEELVERRREKLRRDASSLREKVGDGVETEDIVSAVRETREDR
ncbi:hypothetical protein [Natronococcus occultus]|uniref:Ribbon-helix-helix protein CopG domain-containing protein n=1 Tax=Natronococcus occultus SP4 TaxID=694430 RepID=L0JZV2_9EURY|nr:hypothetical protein [Natronococcus occultus]AGB37393.1 hypothetical protein Natoc_1587 [Natronococcus occultus SP4]